MILMGEMLASPAAISICAPYGIIPCIRQEKVSRILAAFLRSRWNFTAISLAIGPVVIMAIVLLAVHKLAILTRAAMLSSAPLLPLTWRVSFRTVSYTHLTLPTKRIV